MPTADIVIVIIILLSAVIGLLRGLLKEVLSLATWFAAFILALYFAPVLAAQMIGQVEDHSLRLVVGFVTVFLIVLIVGTLAQWMVKKLVLGTGLTGTDRFLGFLFGSARGVLVCIIALIAMRPFAEASEWWVNSAITPEMLAFEQDVLDMMGRAREVVVEVSDDVR